MNLTSIYGLLTVLGVIVTHAWTGSPIAAAGVALYGATAVRDERRIEQDRLLREFSVEQTPGVTDSVAATNTTVTVSPIVTVSPTINPHVQTSAPVAVPTPVAVPVPAPKNWAADIPEFPAHEIIAGQNHAQLVALTDSGKTVLVSAAIRARFNSEGGNCDFWIVDPKGSSFCGLNRSHGYLRVRSDQPKTVGRVIDLLESVMAELSRRIDRRESTGLSTDSPLLTIILDEWPSVLKMIENHHGSSARKKAVALVESLLFMGREDRISLWLVTQSHFVKQIGLDSSVRDQMAVFALGRSGRLETLDRLANDGAMIPSDMVRANIRQGLTNVSSKPDPIPYCLTTLGGGTLGRLPDLTDYINWQFPLPQETAPQDKTDSHTAPRAIIATSQQRAAIVDQVRAGEVSEPVLIWNVFGVTRNAPEYPDCRSALIEVLDGAGLIEQWHLSRQRQCKLQNET